MSADLQFRLLHALAIKGLGSTDALVAVTGVEAPAVDDELAELARTGAVLRREGRVAGWALTPAGRELHAHARAEEVLPSAARSELDAGYERFLALNLPFKELVTAWQLEGRPVRCRTQLDALDLEAAALCRDLGSAHGRFDQYARRLAGAKARFDGGDEDALTRPMSESYHDVWMELHQDLLVTLGRTRSEADGS
jgi:hypothetical protein